MRVLQQCYRRCRCPLPAQGRQLLALVPCARDRTHQRNQPLRVFNPQRGILSRVVQMETTWLRNSGNLNGLLDSITLVPGGGFEPPRVAPHAPQTCASARFRHPGVQRPSGHNTAATGALSNLIIRIAGEQCQCGDPLLHSATRVEIGDCDLRWRRRRNMIRSVPHV